MSVLYHASPSNGIKELEPRVSNHGKAHVYFSSKRENVLVYLSNAIEKYCKETGFDHIFIMQYVIFQDMNGKKYADIQKLKSHITSN